MRGETPRVEPPALDAYSDVPLYNTKAVVHQTSVPAPTLRAWERRYGILTPRRGSNEYRLYSERDIVTVVWLRERVQSGMTISQAIALLKSLQAGRQPHPPARSRANGAYTNGLAPSAVLASPPRYSLIELQDTLLRQLASFDEASARRTITHALAVHTVEDVCTDLFSPVLTRIGEMWADGKLDVVTEHFAANVVRSHLESIFRGMGEFDTGPLVLVGCAPGELHEIGALMFALFLRRAGVRAAYLGQNVEPESLLRSIQTLRPAVVVLAAVMPESARNLANVAALISGQFAGDVMFGFGGPAFSRSPEAVESIPGLFLDADLAAATNEIRSVLSG